MLAIKTGNLGGRSSWTEWHVGEPIPSSANERVVTFQADGDELDLFLDAMHASRGEANGIAWEKGRSFRTLVVPDPKKIFRIWYKPYGKNGCTDPIDIKATSTGIVRETRYDAARWIDTNPAHGGTWSIREENA